MIYIKFTICSIIQSVWIAPTETFACYNNWFFVETKTPLTVIGDNCRKIIDVGNIVIGSNFIIRNTSKHQMGQFFCILFNPHFDISTWKRISIITQESLVNSISTLFLKKIYRKNSSPSSLQQKICNNLSLIFEMLQVEETLNSNFNQQRSNKIDSRLIKINRYIRNNLNKNITLQELADLIDSNPIYLCNTYSKVFKVSPIKHLQIKKIQKAKQLLKETNLSIADISSSLGFYSISHFSETFKKNIGVPPAKFRKLEK